MPVESVAHKRIPLPEREQETEIAETIILGRDQAISIAAFAAGAKADILSITS